MEHHPRQAAAGVTAVLGADGLEATGDIGTAGGTIWKGGPWSGGRWGLGEMASPDGQVRIWLGIFRRRLVVLSSPHPVSECLPRLAGVTTSRGPMTWVLEPP